MLSATPLKAFIPTTHPSKAESFYRDVLGLELISKDKFGIEFNANGISLRVTNVPSLTPHPFTVLGWNVPDISGMVQTLSEKGVAFERYDFMDQDKNNVWTSPSGTRVAWFKDPDGNLLSISQLP